MSKKQSSLISLLHECGCLGVGSLEMLINNLKKYKVQCSVIHDSPVADFCAIDPYIESRVNSFKIQKQSPACKSIRILRNPIFLIRL